MRFFIGFFVMFCAETYSADLVSAKAIVSNHLSHAAAIKQGTDVHILDSYVSQNLVSLKNIGCTFNFGETTLSVDAIKEIVFAYLDENPGFYTKYEDSPVSHQDLKNYIDNALKTASNEKTVFEIYSLSVSALKHIKEKDDLATYMQQLFYVFAENYKTQGGCFQGVRNRIFVYYSYALISYLQSIE